MESLPLEITSNVLLRLSVKTLGQLRCVSKTLTTSPYFTKTHHNQIPSAQRRYQLLLSASSLHTLNIFHNNTPPVYLRLPSNAIKKYCGATHELVGSCNGLVCIYYPPNNYSLLNPTTRELRLLPNPETLPLDARARLHGFGYVSKFDDYMIVSIGTDESVIRVFSAKADLWKTVSTSVPLPVLPWVKPVYVNNVVHWLGNFDVGEYQFRPVHHIMGFDFVDEEFKVLPLCEDLNQRLITTLGVLGGDFCVLSRGVDDNMNLDMWVMKEYGVGESWIRILLLPVYPNLPFVSLSPICPAGIYGTVHGILFLADSRCLLFYDFVNYMT
ncbi:F-box domain-containing protein [Heracleum sosnowskyi]|uniref:F-box domain-containing protein n=1 Tax=Heracleum sosnowskyi TaxID=360622 RepID=A0AAD8GW37_9APIA|nr:F-box domain-containing protein [Heracleum sosnowskyi]